NLFLIGFAQHLKETSMFLLPNEPIAVCCLRDYHSNLVSFSLSSDLVPHCFDPMLL
ncbi:hypothetical protein CCACVL1_00757, partial [Corchorus capsularis]